MASKKPSPKKTTSTKASPKKTTRKKVARKKTKSAKAIPKKIVPEIDRKKFQFRRLYVQTKETQRKIFLL